MPTREKIANVNSSVDCWIQINPIHHTEFVPTQVKLTALYGSCFCLWETHVDVALMVSPSRTPGPFFLTPTTPKRLLRRLLGPVHTKKVCVFVFIEKASMNSRSHYRFDAFSTVRTETCEKNCTLWLKLNTMRMPQTRAPVIFSVIVFILIRFPRGLPQGFSTIYTTMICTRFRFDPL